MTTKVQYTALVKRLNLFPKDAGKFYNIMNNFSRVEQCVRRVERGDAVGEYQGSESAHHKEAPLAVLEHLPRK
jgi:hypothetical protein